MDSVDLPFGDFSGQNSLFVDFVNQFSKVQNFYNPPPLEDSDIKKRIEKSRQSCQVPRSHFTSSLSAYNKNLHDSSLLNKHLEAFKSKDCVTVITGQQVGLFGGPSFTVFKAATAICLAAQLRKKGINAVPIFWMASNDSDFEEIRNSHFVDSNNNLLSLRFPKDSKDLFQMAGTVKLDAIGDCLDQLFTRVDSYPYAEPVLKRLSQAYIPSRSFREGFASWISHLFRDYGLIVFDPLMDIHRSHLSHFYEIAITHRENLIETLQKRNRQISKAGYEPQVSVDTSESLLFLIDEYRRYKLIWEKGKYRAKGPKKLSFSTKDLLRLAGKEPERMGFNVLLRPILQDYFFPTAFYIGGPAEVAYFSQVNSIADYWGVEPVILPRAGFTIVNRRSQRYLKQNHLQPVEILQKSNDALIKRVLQETQQSETLEQIESLEEKLRISLKKLQKSTHSSDPTVSAMLDNTQDKMLYQLEKVKARFITNYRHRSPVLKKHIDYLLTHLKPLNNPQERVLNFNHFLLEQGPTFLHEIMEMIDPLRFSHKILHT